MSLIGEIEQALPESAVVAESQTTDPITGKSTTTYSVNAGGVVLQYVIPTDETDAGVLEDFVEHIEATVREVMK